MRKYVADAHALEQRAIGLLERGPKFASASSQLQGQQGGPSQVKGTGGRDDGGRRRAAEFVQTLLDQHA
jgi:hypothetical protein